MFYCLPQVENQSSAIEALFFQPQQLFFDRHIGKQPLWQPLTSS
jgi:hypothetical protein